MKQPGAAASPSGDGERRVARFGGSGGLQRGEARPPALARTGLLAVVLLSALSAACDPQPTPPPRSPVLTAAPVSSVSAAPSATADLRQPDPSSKPPEEDNGPLPPPSPPPRVARGVDTPADKALAEGDAAYAKADYAAAEKAYSKAQTLAPKDPACAVGLARARLGKAGVPEGFGSAPDDKTAKTVAADLKKAVALDAAYGPVQTELARVLLVLGQADDALVAARKGTDLSPSDAEAHSALGVALLATGDVEKALASLKRSVELAGGDFARQLNLGTAYLAAGRPVDAQPVFRRALRIKPDDPRAENGLGTALLAEGDPVKATPHLEKAVAGDPENASYKSNLGYAWSLRGDLAKAIELYKKAVEKNPKLVSAWINLGNAQASKDDFAEACAAYAKVHAIDPADPRLKNALIEVDELAKKKGLAGAGCKVTASK